MRTSRVLRASAVVLAFGLVAAACGDDEEDTGEDTTTTVAGGEGSATTAAGGTGEEATGGDYCANEPDPALDEERGARAATMHWIITCAEERPLVAEGDPIVIGFQNPKGDPAGTFPEYETAALAAVEYINNELGGVGADWTTGTPGRPIQLEVCSMAINPADSQKCANELAGKNPFAVFSSLNFFGNHFEIYNAAGVPVFVGSPITIADFTTPQNVYSIGSGGGCLGVHTGLVEYAAVELGATRVGVPWADTPPGVVCYHDLEAKPLEVLAGTIESSSELAGSLPDLQYLGVPIKPATADVTPQAQQILDFSPEAIIFSGQSADCWNLVSALGKLGWTNDQAPLVLSGACLDLPKIEQVGDLATGITFIGSPPVSQPDLNQGALRVESEIYVAKMAKYGAEDDTVKGFATQGFTGLMLLYTMLQDFATENGVDALEPAAFLEVVESTSNYFHFGAVPMGCADIVAPYSAVCSNNVSAQQWTGDTFELRVPVFTGVDLVDGTELAPSIDALNALKG